MTAPTGQRLPMSVVGSIGMHAGILILLMYTARVSNKAPTHVIGNVDLMIQVHKEMALPKPVQARAPTPPSTWNFLKMALPAAPKMSALQSLDVKVPEHRAIMQATPKLQDKGRLNAGPKLEDKIDMSSRRPEMATIDAKAESRHTAQLASMPKLEDVGRRQVRNLPAAIKLEEQRQQALSLQSMNALGSAAERSHAPAPVGEPLQDAAPAAGSRFANKIASMLPTESGIDMHARPVAMPVPKNVIDEPAPVKRKAAQAMTEQKKKGVDIEGPLADRKVLSYDVPEFPKWARDQGVLEANVSIRFWVDTQGNVLPNMRVEHTSGYGQLDRLAMDSLKNWKFAPLLEDERQWGIITFRFVLE